MNCSRGNVENLFAAEAVFLSADVYVTCNITTQKNLNGVGIMRRSDEICRKSQSVDIPRTVMLKFFMLFESSDYIIHVFIIAQKSMQLSLFPDIGFGCC